MSILKTIKSTLTDRRSFRLLRSPRRDVIRRYARELQAGYSAGARMPQAARTSEAQYESFDGGVRAWRGMFGEMSATVTQGALEFMVRAAYIDPQISGGRKNIRALGATAPVITIRDRSEREERAIRQRIEELDIRLSRGLTGLTHQYFDQMLSAGAISSEDVLSPGLDRVERVELVPVAGIVFRYENERNVPYQRRTVGGDVKLDIPTYRYIPVESMEGSPYGVPPFIAAARSVLNRWDADDNVRFILRKFGLLGLVICKLALPDNYVAGDPTSEAEFNSRLQARLTALDENFNQGLLVSPDDASYEVFNPAGGGGDRSVGLHESIKSMVWTGMMPGMGALFGQENLPVQSFARVLFMLLSEAVGSYQEFCAIAMRGSIYNDLRLGRIDPQGVTVGYERLSGFDPLSEGQAWTTELTGWIRAAQSGLVTADEVAMKFFGHTAVDPKLILTAAEPTAFLQDKS